MLGLRRLFPKTVDFLAYFERASENLVEGALAFRDLVDHYDDLPLKVQRIKHIENEGDRITHQTLDALNKTFITPIDREDIHSLISALDDVLDLIDAAAHRLLAYKIESPTPELKEYTESLIRPIETLKTACLLMDNMRHARRILDLCVEVNRLENEADNLHRVAITDLFDNEKDPIRLLKLKEIYENLESAIDRCEDVANIIEGIVLKNS